MLLLLISCWTKEIPAHLQPGLAAPVTAPVSAPVDLSEAMDRLVARDPLLRRPDLDAAAQWPPLDPALSAYLDRVAEQPAEPAAFQSLEQEHPGTVAVVLARGWRLAAIEHFGTQLSSSLPLQRQAGLWLMPFGASGVTPQDRGPWSWLPPDQILTYAEQWVFRAWLEAPDLPQQALAETLSDPTFDRLALSPEGLILSAPRAGDADLTALNDLVTLFLESVAADSNSEQARHRENIEALEEQLGVEHAALETYAQSVRLELGSAGGDRGRGGALMAWQVERWLDPSRGWGLDRSENLQRAARWEPSLEAPAAVLQVALLKDLVDRLEVGLKRGRITHLLPPLADALNGVGHARLPMRWLERPGPEPATWLDLTRAAGAPDGTTPEEGLAALNALLVERCTVALRNTLPSEQRALIERIQRKATQ